MKILAYNTPCPRCGVFCEVMGEADKDGDIVIVCPQCRVAWWWYQGEVWSYYQHEAQADPESVK